MSDYEMLSYSEQSSSARGSRWIDNLLFTLLTIGTLSLAIPFAGVTPWMKLTFTLFIIVLFFAWLVTRPMVKNKVPAPFARLWLPGLLMMLVCLWAIVQVLPLPILNHPSWQFSSESLGSDLTGSISLDRAESIKELIFLITLGFLFWLSMQLGRDAGRARLALLAFVFAVSLNAAYGIAMSLLDLDYILWQRKQDYLSSVTGTFVNRNSFATYLSLALVVASAIVIDDAVSSRRRNLPLKLRLAEMLDALFGKNALRLVAIFILATALILTQSRAGNVAFVVGLLFTVAAYTATGKLRIVYALVFGLLIILPSIIILMVSGGALIDRLDVSGEELSAARLPLFARVWEMIQDYWATGVGLGNFRQGFYPYIDDSIMTARTWYSAHSTYLDLMAELGIIFAAAMFMCVFLLMLDCWFGLRRRRRHSVFAAVGVGATGVIAFHSLVDFSLSIPAVAVAYTYLLAIGVSQSAPTRH